MNLLSQLATVRSFGKCLIWNTRQSERCIQTSPKSLKQVLTRTLRIRHEDFYKRMDRVPQDYEMIYKMPLHYTLNMGKAAAVVTGLAVPFIWLYNELYPSQREKRHFIGTAAIDEGDLKWFAVGLLVTNLLIFRTCHVIAMRLYRHQKSYVAIIPGMVPRYNSKFHFNEGELTEHFNAISFFRGITYKANGRTIILIPDRFRKSSDLFEMLQQSDAKKYTNPQ